MKKSMMSRFLTVVTVIGAVLLVFAYQPELAPLNVLVFFPFGLALILTSLCVVSFQHELGLLKPLDWILLMFMLLLVPAFWLVAADYPVLWVLFVVYPCVAARLLVYYFKEKGKGWLRKESSSEDTARNT